MFYLDLYKEKMSLYIMLNNGTADLSKFIAGAMLSYTCINSHSQVSDMRALLVFGGWGVIVL